MPNPTPLSFDTVSSQYGRLCARVVSTVQTSAPTTLIAYTLVLEGAPVRSADAASSSS